MNIFNNKVDIFSFMKEFFDILRIKGISSIEKNEFEKIINNFKSLEKYNLLFENPDLIFDDTLKNLQKIKFIHIFNTNPNTIYITGDNSFEIGENKFEELVEKLVDDYIFIIKNNNKYNNLNIYLCDNTNLNYKLVKGSNKNTDIKWNVITDGDIKEYKIIKNKKFYPDVLNENVILYLSNLIIKNILLENSSFVLYQGIIDDVIVKNELYLNNLNDQLLNEISPYFMNEKFDDCKIKRLTLK